MSNQRFIDTFIYALIMIMFVILLGTTALATQDIWLLTNEPLSPLFHIALVFVVMMVISMFLLVPTLVEEIYDL